MVMDILYVESYVVEMEILKPTDQPETFNCNIS